MDTLFEKFFYDVSERVGCSKKHIEKIITPLFDCLKEALYEDERITISNFGTFQIKHMREKISQPIFR